MIRVCREWGIMAQRDFTHRGVWIGKNKLGSVGIAIRRGISFHGFSLNVNPSLKPFTWINPCGLEVVISSMEQELSQSISMNNVHRAIKNHLEEVFGIELLTTCLPELYSFLNNSRDLLKYQKNNNVKDYNIYHVGQNA
jgi:lipoate-protein ligase B